MITIQGPRLTLRTMTREEYHTGKRKYVSDPIMDPNPYVYDAPKVDAGYDKCCAEEETYPRVGIFLPDGEIIGELSFKRINYERSRCELGIMLLNDGYKEQGYGREAFAMACGYAFSTLGLKTIYADTMGSNIRMQRVMERLGFTCYMRMEDCYDMGDRWEDRLDYVLQREAFVDPAAGGPA